MRFWIPFFLSVLLLSTTQLLSSHAQELGRYPIHNFNHRDYSGHSQNWAVIQDPRGLIYAANNKGVIEYDGSDWRYISINGALSRCLDIDAEGRVWVGGQDEVGYLAADSSGSLRYFSLIKDIPSYCLPLGLVRQVFATKDGIYFSSNQTLIRIKGKSIKVWRPKTYFHRAFYAMGNLFINQPEYGLAYMKNDSLKLTPNTDYVSKKLIYSLQANSKNKLLIGTQSEGLYLYNTDILRTDTTIHKDSIITKFHVIEEKFLAENLIYSSITLPNGNTAIGTSRKGVLIIDRYGNTIRKINQSSNLQDESIWNLFLDNQNNLWMALNNGISYTNINSQLTSWDENSGLRGSVQSVIRFNKSLYVSTNIGIFKKENGEFQELKGFNKYTYKLHIAHSSDNRDILLASAADGIYQIENDVVKRIGNYKQPCYSFYSSKIFPNITYAALNDGVGILRYQNGGIIYLGQLESTKGQVYSLVEDQHGTLWYSNRYKGVDRCNIVNPYQLIIDQQKSYHQLPFAPKCDDMAISLINGMIKVSTDKGLCRYNSKADRFIPDSSLGVEFTEGNTGIRILNQDEYGNLWFEVYKDNPNRWIERAIKYSDNTYRRIPAKFRIIPDMIFNDVLSEENDINWISSYDGLYRFDGSFNSDNQSIIKLLIRRIVANQSKVIYNGASALPNNRNELKCTNFSQTTNVVQKLNSTDNSIVIFFSSPFFGQNQKMKYSYKLEGYDKDWSDWTSDQKKEYTNLPSGNYKFIVKARNVFDTESPIASCSFFIKRPWFKSPVSFALYMLILAGIIWIYVTIKTNLLKGSNLRLQALVKERTKDLILFQEEIIEKNEELMQQKEEMQVQRDELHEQNRQTSASLEYAKTIQQAILPDLNVLSDRLEHFIIYKPKDVVSGDFYWISRLSSKSKQGEKIFVAVVDCTGHGVPGAFMSMIGSRMLSEIVNERKIHNPADILTELSNSVNQALRQDVSESFDGMDACICLIEQKIANQYIITFAGANRMLYYYQKGTHKIQSLRGNRKTIGGIMPDVDPEFLNNRIYLSPGDMVFLNSDGIVDQNNEHRKKFTASRFHFSLLENIDKPMEHLGLEINSAFERFKGNAFQRDDITVLGLRLREDNG